MTGYTFVYGVDGFGADVDPAYEEGIYLDYNKAYNHLKELTTQIIENEIQDEIIYIDDHEYKRDEILSKMDKPTNYSAYRDRLLKRGVITSRQAYISLALPYFGDYVNEYCMSS